MIATLVIKRFSQKDSPKGLAAFRDRKEHSVLQGADHPKTRLSIAMCQMYVSHDPHDTVWQGKSLRRTGGRSGGGGVRRRVPGLKAWLGWWWGELVRDFVIDQRPEPQQNRDNNGDAGPERGLADHPLHFAAELGDIGLGGSAQPADFAAELGDIGLGGSAQFAHLLAQFAHFATQLGNIPLQVLGSLLNAPKAFAQISRSLAAQTCPAPRDGEAAPPADSPAAGSFAAQRGQGHRQSRSQASLRSIHSHSVRVSYPHQASIRYTEWDGGR